MSVSSDLRYRHCFILAMQTPASSRTTIERILQLTAHETTQSHNTNHRRDLPFDTEHRPWPVPDRPWAMHQAWNDLLFAHWPVAPSAIRSLMPLALEPETFDGAAWVGVVPFWMSDIRLHWLPEVPGLASFPELNVRTYVTIDDKPGVYFFSLDAGNRVAVEAARRWFHLPYFKATMTVEHDGDTIRYRSERKDVRGKPAELTGWYRPAGEKFRSKPGSLERWLTERYCLYTTDRKERLYRADILHNPWILQPAEAEFATQSMLDAHGIIPIEQPPLLLFSKRLEMIAWTPERIS